MTAQAHHFGYALRKAQKEPQGCNHCGSREVAVSAGGRKDFRVRHVCLRCGSRWMARCP
jgi:transposase-like protein